MTTTVTNTVDITADPGDVWHRSTDARPKPSTPNCCPANLCLSALP
jgi:hypothetical protein